MMDIHTLAKALGRNEIAAALGISRSAVDNAVREGSFPAAWGRQIRRMASEKRLGDVPDDAFRWLPRAPEPAP